MKRTRGPNKNYDDDTQYDEAQVQAMIRKAVRNEREACARVCEDIDTEYEGEDVLATWCAAAIRARGNSETHR